MSEPRHQHQRERPWRNCNAPLEPLPDSELVFPWRAGEVVLSVKSPKQPAAWLSLPETEQQTGREATS
jgi:hypothetical protein